MKNYKKLKELIREQMDQEKENFQEAKAVAGVNCCGACSAVGAVDAYKQVLADIEELESEVGNE